MGCGISMDVENLRLRTRPRSNRQQRAWSLNLAGSRYFERPPLASYDELDRRMRSKLADLPLDPR